jgi:hypothetical protein
MAPKPVSAEIYTTSHRVLGRISPGASGLFSYLNIRTTSYVEVDGAHLNRLHQPAKLVARYPQLWLVKNEIVAILVSNRMELGPAGITRRGYTTMVQHSVHIMLGGYEMRGLLEMPGKFDFGSVMFEGDQIFLPLYNAELIAILFPSVRAGSPAALFNREMVDAMVPLPRDDSSGGTGRLR